MSFVYFIFKSFKGKEEIKVSVNGSEVDNCNILEVSGTSEFNAM